MHAVSENGCPSERCQRHANRRISAQDRAQRGNTYGQWRPELIDSDRAAWAASNREDGARRELVNRVFLRQESAFAIRASIWCTFGVQSMDTNYSSQQCPKGKQHHRRNSKPMNVLWNSTDPWVPTSLTSRIAPTKCWTAAGHNAEQAGGCDGEKPPC